MFPNRRTKLGCEQRARRSYKASRVQWLGTGAPAGLRGRAGLGGSLGVSDTAASRGPDVLTEGGSRRGWRVG